jgi:hypothetical protein
MVVTISLYNPRRFTTLIPTSSSSLPSLNLLLIALLSTASFQGYTLLNIFCFSTSLRSSSTYSSVFLISIFFILPHASSTVANCAVSSGLVMTRFFFFMVVEGFMCSLHHHRRRFFIFNNIFYTLGFSSITVLGFFSYILLYV